MILFPSSSSELVSLVLIVQLSGQGSPLAPSVIFQSKLSWQHYQTDHTTQPAAQWWCWWSGYVLISQQSDQAGVHHNHQPSPTITHKQTSTSAEIFWLIWYVRLNEETRLCTLLWVRPCEHIKFSATFYLFLHHYIIFRISEYFQSISIQLSLCAESTAGCYPWWWCSIVFTLLSWLMTDSDQSSCPGLLSNLSAQQTSRGGRRERRGERRAR